MTLSYIASNQLPQKSILVPTAEPDPTLYLKVFRPIFSLPRAIVYNSWEEKRIINLYSNNYNVPGDVVGVGSEIPYEYNENRFKKKYGIEDKFLLYIGRIDKNKGVDHLFDFSVPTSRRGTQGEQGTGFGMPLVKMFMERFGGKIIIKSQLQQGTSFSLLFKIAK